MLQSRRAWMAESCSGSKLTKKPPRASARCAKRKKRYEVCRRRESHLKQSRRPKRPTDLSHGYSTVEQRVWHTHVDKSLERPVQHEAFFSSSSASPAIPCTSTFITSSIVSARCLERKRVRERYLKDMAHRQHLTCHNKCTYLATGTVLGTVATVGKRLPNNARCGARQYQPVTEKSGYAEAALTLGGGKEPRGPGRRA